MSTRYTDHSPSSVLNNPNAAAYVGLFDALQSYKEQLINQGNTFYNPVLNVWNNQFLRYGIEELGWPTVPSDFPLEILDNMILNSENIMRLRGSKMGFDYWLRVLTCGLPTVDDSQFYPLYDYIILNDTQNGFLFSESMYPYHILYLFGDELPVTTQILTVGIATPYYYLQSLQDYINNNIRDFIGFSDGNAEITVTLVDGPRVINPYANPYFVNDF